MVTLQQVRAQMNARYATDSAYSDALPYDRSLRMEICDLVLRMLLQTRNGLREVPTLDVGCGQEGIARYWPHKQIVGIELSETAVAEARRRTPEATYVATAVEDFGPEHTSLYGAFDVAVAVETIEHWIDVDRGLDAVVGALAPGGELLLTTPNRDSLHCRMSRKLGREAPTVSYDHIHEFGFEELKARVERHGVVHREALGAHLSPYWTLEKTIGPTIRRLTDNDEEVLAWLNEIGRSMPPAYAYVQAHRFQKEHR